MKLERSDNPNPPLQRALELISALCDETINAEQVRELESLVLGQAQIRNVYLRMMHLDAGLRHYASALGNLPDSSVDLHGVDSDGADLSGVDLSGVDLSGVDLSGDDLSGLDLGGLDLSGVAENDASRHGMDETMELPAIEDAQPNQIDEFDERFQSSIVLPPPPRQQPRTDRGLSPIIKGGLAALLVMSLGVGVVAHFLRTNAGSGGGNAPKMVAFAPLAPPVPIAPPTPVVPAPPPIPVATLDLTSKPIWGAPGMPPQDGKFVAGQTLSLTSGDVQLYFHRGGRLVIEGPAEVKFVSDSKIELHRGSIVATVPGGGLAVACPNGVVTDLGTEFGLAVGSDGATEVAVFKGRVSAALSSSAATQPAKPMLLNGGQAAVMTEHALAVDAAGAIPQRFVRNLINGQIKSLDVTDMVCGGDGTTHQRGVIIDPTTGQLKTAQRNAYVPSDDMYHEVKGYPVIDGVFIPDGTKNAMVVDSAGDRFGFSPAGPQGYGYIITGGALPYISSVLGGVDYGTRDHSIILLHSNNAITIDLDAVRRMYPDRALTAFHCGVGNSYIPRGGAAAVNIPAATVYVLLNGVARYEKAHFTGLDGRIAVDIPLVRQDRFLTLVSTDAGKGNDHDRILWTDAKLDVSAAQ